MKNIFLIASLFILTACGGATTTETTEVTVNPALNAIVATYGEHTVLARDFLYTFRNNLSQEEQFLAQWLELDENQLQAHWQEIPSESSLTNMEILRQRSLEQALEQGTMLVIVNEANVGYDQELLAESMVELRLEIQSLDEMGMDGDQIFYDFYGMTTADFEYVQRNILLAVSYVDYLRENIEISDSEVIEHIQSNPQLGPMQARVVHVLISPNEDLTHEEASDIADEILQRINLGEDPRVLAAEYSDDPGSPDGFYEFPRGMMVPSFEEWAFNANPGDTGIVQSQFGFHVMYSEGHDTLEEILANNALSDELIQNIREDMTQERAIDTLMQMIEDSNIQWTVNEDILAQIS